MKETVLVTGAAGFIGSSLVERLCDSGYGVVGLDNFDDFYSPAVKWSNIRSVVEREEFTLVRGDIRDQALLARVFRENHIDQVVHLAARAGVRPSLKDPALYEEVNIFGTINVLEESRKSGVERITFASSSSVYGTNNCVPFKEDDKVAQPASPYAASKAAGELFCYTYNHLYHIPITALRFFTVYGPRQRPEMAIHMFTRMIDAGEEITVFGSEESQRDYTFIDDILDGIIGAMNYRHQGFHIFNLGDSRPVALGYLIQLIEKSLGKKARIKMAALQPGDVPVTFADISKAKHLLNYQPEVSIEAGVARFGEWYRKKMAPARLNVV